MPVDADSAAWADADPERPLQEELLAFLRKNESWAFHAREMADEFLDTSWELTHRREREIRRVGEQEFYERLDAGEYEDEYYVGNDDSPVADSIKTQAVIAILHDFAREGLVEIRNVPVEETNIPYEDWDVVEHFTYVGD